MHVDEILIANAQRYKQIRVNEVVGPKPQIKLLEMLKFAYKNWFLRLQIFNCAYV